MWAGTMNVVQGCVPDPKGDVVGFISSLERAPSSPGRGKSQCKGLEVGTAEGRWETWVGVVGKWGDAGGMLHAGNDPLESPQPHSWCPVGMAGDGCSPGLHFSTITALGTVTTIRPSLGCPHQAGMKNRLSRGGDRSHQPKAVTCPCSASLPLPTHGTTPCPSCRVYSFIHSIQLFSGPQKTRQILTRYRAEARKKTGVGLGKRWRSCCVKRSF